MIVLRLLTLAVSCMIYTQAFAIHKCELDGKISYSDTPCQAGKAMQLDAAAVAAPASEQEARNAQQRAVQDRQKLDRIEKERDRVLTREEKSRAKADQLRTAAKRRCTQLALQKKWAEEDLAAADVKRREKLRRAARKQTEKYEVECKG